LLLKKKFYGSPSKSSLETDTELQQLTNVKVKHNTGRTRKSFQEASEVTKRRRISELSSLYTAEELAKALKKKIADNIKETEIGHGNHQNACHQTLAMFVDTRLSKSKFQNLNTHLERIYGSKLLTSYDTLSEVKKLCYPDHIEMTEFGAKVNFISLLAHTVKRILIQLDPSLLQEIQNKKLLLIGKWGMDGASGQQTTRQKWSDQSRVEYSVSNSDHDGSDDDNDNDPITLSDSDCNDNVLNNDLSKEKFEMQQVKNDATVFIVSFSPLQLKANDRIIWTNNTPSNSVQTCRTVKFEFVKETDSYMKNLYDHYTSLLEKIQTYCLQYDDMSFEVAFDIKCTMIDGKVCNSLTGQRATNSCNICGVTPKNINNLAHVKNRHCSQEFYKFGLSSLHCKIRNMEYLLKILYNSDFRKFQARSQEEKNLRNEKKKCIKKLLKSKLSLTVDIVKQGAETINTGNVARTFFENANVVAECTGLDENLIKRFHNILQVISCNTMINCQAMKEYCEKLMKCVYHSMDGI